MSTLTPTVSTGMPVAIGQIERELKKLWEADAQSSRASLINLAVYCEGKDAMADNTDLIARITKAHACRAILICTEPSAQETSIQAWISAHCHMSRAGAKQICCEQITFLLEGPSLNLIPNIVFSHLDSDLPLYLWWQGEFPNPIEHQLWTWVDRLIFDSNAWSNPTEQLHLLQRSLEETPGRLTLCDLNWARSVYIRQALSLTFDNPELLHYLSEFKKGTVTHSPEYRSTAILFLAWVAAQLGWVEGAWTDTGITFFTLDGRSIAITLNEKSGPPISEVEFSTGEALFSIKREGVSDFLYAETKLDDGSSTSVMLPAGKEGRAALVTEELSRGGSHLVYLRALAVAKDFF
jgi:glucose-6-phosphate dehydrogenase assembly protein OpcA